MNRFFFACVFTMAGILVGCDGGGLTPNQKAAANKQWNDARASVLASLANDQYKSGNLDKCQETLDQALRLEPENAALHLQAAKLCIEQNKLEAAQAHLTEAAKLQPKNGEVDYLSGVVLQRWQQTKEAADAYSAAVAKNPSELCYLLAQAETLVGMDRCNEALLLLQAKAKQFEHSCVIRDEIGQILVQEHRSAEAVTILREASILAGDDVSVREHLAFALMQIRQYGEASDLFARLSKEPAYAKRADIFAAMGTCQAESQQLRAAKASFQQATTLVNSNSGYWLGLGRVGLQLEDLAVAESAARKAISISPQSSEAQCLLGYVQFKQNSLPASLTAFQSASNLDSSDSVSLCLQGYILSKMGRSTESHVCYKKALQLNPHDELASRLMAGLDSHD